MNRPIVSIIVPIYNVEPYVEDCIMSVMRQMYDNEVECIVVDDCGTDNSMAIVEKLISEYDGAISFKILHHAHNCGLSVARNTGVNAAIGEWLWFVDSDDWIEENAMKTLIPILKENEDKDVICVQKKNYVKQKCKLSSVNDIIVSPLLLSGKQYMHSKLQKAVAPKFIVKRVFLENNKIGFFPNILHEDILYFYTMMYKVKKVYVLKDSLYGRRLGRGDSITNTISPKNANDMIIIHKELMKYLSSEVDEEDRDWFFRYSFSSIVYAYKLINRFHDTPVYSEFQRNHKPYINSICKKALYSGGSWGFKLTSIVIRFFPFYIRSFEKICSKVNKYRHILKIK